MKPFLLGVGALYLTFLPVLAQDSASSPEPAAPPVAKSARPVVAYLKESTSAGTSTTGFCHLEGRRDLAGELAVVVVRRAVCESVYGPQFNARHLEIFWKSRRFLVPESAVELSAKDLAQLDTHDAATVEANAKKWEAASGYVWSLQADEALKQLKRAEREGIAILESSVYDESRYTQGTGWSVKVTNYGNKTIKYITFSLVGLNAVRDPVRGLNGQSTTVTLRGVGPIVPGETAGYSRDYMWMTDVVEYHRISQVRLEFMDGTVRTVRDPKAVQLSDLTRAILDSQD